VTALEATRLVAERDGAGDLGALLRAHLATRIGVARGGDACTPAVAPRSLASRAGVLRVELRFACPARGALRVTNEALFDLAPSHVHTARFAVDGARAFELLFTSAARAQALEDAAAAGGVAPAGTPFARYVALGVEHIAAGADHVAFLVALLVLCRRLRDVAWLVTGFTVGHSVTLSLAVLGVVQPNVPVVEALIGFTIALVAAENVAVRSATGRRAIAVAAAAGLAALALARAVFDVGLPVSTSLGLAVFAAAYLPPADASEVLRLRPLLTLLFGLVHGFGFASVLLEIGLPAGRLASALLGFNLGVELGQLAIVAVLWGAARLVASRLPEPASPLALDALSAALCGLGLFWFVERGLGA
jgi:hypothetical protein